MAHLENGRTTTRSRSSKAASLLRSTSRIVVATLFCKKQVDAEIEDFDEEFRSGVTQVHVTVMDEVVSVNTFFCVSVFLGLLLNPAPSPGVTPLAPSNPACKAGLDYYRYLLTFEVLAFSCFLFSTAVAHGIKLYILLGNGDHAENAKTAYINNRILRLGILFAAIGTAVGTVFLTLSLLNMIQIKLGTLSCGSVWTHRAAIPLIVLVSSGVFVFCSSVFVAFRN